MEIGENKCERSQVACEEENEENRGLIDKKASEDHLEIFFHCTFCQFSFGALSLFSLTLTLGHLEFSWITLALDQERQRRKEEGRRNQGIAGSSSYNRILCMY